MMLVAGLGNPGGRYAGNRHNIGFMAIDEIARDPAFSPFSKKFSGEIAEGVIDGEKIVLLKPLTFMNESGRSVGEAARFFKIEPKDVVVIHDELDLAAGRVRVKTGGGHGGHNGLRSIDAHLGTRDYKRVRLGIGHPGHKDQVSPYVLSDFHKVDREWLDPLIENVRRHFGLLVKGDDALFMNRLAPTGKVPEKGEATVSAEKRKGKSHIHQARSGKPSVAIPEKGPMAEMLKRMFGKTDS